MKTTVKKIIGSAALGLALFTNSVPTWAGEARQYPVTIGIFNNEPEAYGTKLGARYSADTKQGLGCRVYATPAYWFASCSASDSTGASLGCITSDPQMRDAITAITDGAFVTFRRAADSIACTRVRVDASSQYLR